MASNPKPDSANVAVSRAPVLVPLPSDSDSDEGIGITPKAGARPKKVPARAGVASEPAVQAVAPEPAVQAVASEPAGQAPVPAPAPVPMPPQPLNIEPKVRNEGHRQIVDFALPLLRRVMQSPEHAGLEPRLLVRKSLEQMDSRDRIWGKWTNFSRKRTVEDAILQFYFDDVLASV